MQTPIHEKKPSISHAKGSKLYTTDNRMLIDLCSGFGSVFLGHCHPAISNSIATQLTSSWSIGRENSPILESAHAAVKRIIPRRFSLAGFYSTGMEASEYALRLAAAITGRNSFIGFRHSMHGKSVICANLCWENTVIQVSNTQMLPYSDIASDDEILSRLEATLKSHSIAALVVEPIQGTNNCWGTSASTLDEIVLLCHKYGTLCIFDEILTGLFRTGKSFICADLGSTPDILLFAKSIGNGFPSSAVAVDSKLPDASSALPGSTFSDNPLAASAIASTLALMATLPMSNLIADIEKTIQHILTPITDENIILRGQGALWAIEFKSSKQLKQTYEKIVKENIMVSVTSNSLRLLPCATIQQSDLAFACNTITDAIPYNK